MPTVNDITTTPLSGLNYIDALLDKGPDWNFFSPAPGMPANTLYYTFSVVSGTEDAQSTASNLTGGVKTFSAAQQAQTRDAFAYLSKVTGIQFVETSDGTAAQIHLASANLTGGTTTGLCSWHSSYGYSGNQLVSYDADAYVYLDNAEWGAQNSVLTPGGYGYETLLHELGHALGLKHPFDTTTDNTATLPASQDSTLNTLMSYNYVGGAHSTYQPDDLAALNWLYAADGLGGAYGINSANGGRYLTGTYGDDTLVGTTADDKLEGDGGNDMINGGGGNDTAVFRGVRSNYNIDVLSDGGLQVASKDGIDGTDTLHAISTLQFADMSVTRQAILAANSGPLVPTLNLAKDANGYVTGSTPTLTGAADAFDTIKIYTTDNVLVGTATADSNGLFSIALNPFQDGKNYQIYATATTTAGVTSQASQPVSFNVDSHMPVLAVTKNANGYTTGSTPLVNGTGAPGDIIHIYTSDNVLVGTATADSKTGVFSVVLSKFDDANGYHIYATGTSASGATSGHSLAVDFNVDGHAPNAPTAAIDSSGNQVSFSGQGDAGSTISLYHVGATLDDTFPIAQTTVMTDGTWSVKTSPLPNGAYTVAAVAEDLAGNASSGSGKLTFTVNNPGNMVGTDGADKMQLTGANIAIDGGAGLDTLVVGGPRANYTLSKAAYGVVLNDNAGNGGHDTLLNVERVQFSDSSVALDVDGSAGQLFRLYQAAFGRAAEPEGLGYWLWRTDVLNTDMLQVSREFITQVEFKNMYGTDPSDMFFINELYEHVLHREADSGGFAYWMDILQRHPNERPDVLLAFSESAENKALVIGSIQDGMVYTPYHTG